MEQFLKENSFTSEGDTKEQSQIKENHRILNAYVHAYKDMLRLKNTNEEKGNNEKDFKWQCGPTLGRLRAMQ